MGIKGAAGVVITMFFLSGLLFEYFKRHAVSLNDAVQFENAAVLCYIVASLFLLYLIRVICS